MDLVSLYYFSELAKDLHMTRTASRLYISQQTLSNHIARLERQFGIKLLNRRPALSLTLAGEHVAAFAETLNKDMMNLRAVLSDIDQQQRGLLRFGASTMRVNACLPEILARFSARYPKVDLRIVDTISIKLEQMVVDRELDFAVVVSSGRNPLLASHHLMYDQIYLCIADELLHRHYGDRAARLKEESHHGAFLRDFSELPFCILSNRMGQLIEQCFNEVPFVPITYITTANTQVSVDIASRRLAACFASRMNFSSLAGAVPEDMNIFPLYNAEGPVLQEMTLIHRKDHYLSRYSRFFLETLIELFSEIGQLRVERVAPEGGV